MNQPGNPVRILVGMRSLGPFVLLLALALAACWFYFDGTNGGELDAQVGAARKRGVGPAVASELKSARPSDAGRSPRESPRESPRSSPRTPVQVTQRSSQDAHAADSHPDHVVIRLVTPGGHPLSEVVLDKGASRPLLGLWVWAGPSPLGPGDVLQHKPGERLTVATLPLNDSSSEDVRHLTVSDPRVPLFIHVAIGEIVLAPSTPLPAADWTLDVVVDIDELTQDLSRFRLRFVGEEPGEFRGHAVLNKVLPENQISSRSCVISRDALIESQFITPGAYELKVTCEAWADYSTQFELHPGEFLDLGSVPLERRTSIDGQLIGEPRDIANCTVQLRAYDDETVLATSTTNENGWFRFGGLQPGLYLLQLLDDFEQKRQAFEYFGTGDEESAPRHRVTSLLSVDSSGGSVDGVQLYLEEPAELALWAVFNPGDPILCDVRNAGGQVVARREVFPVDGREHLWVAPGSYDVSWSRAGVRLGTRRVQTTRETAWVTLLEDD